MMYCSKFVFIHIPRTGGSTLTNAFGGIPWISKSVHAHKHATAREARLVVGEEIWSTSYKFCIIRPPAEICRSWFRHCVTYLPTGIETGSWLTYCDRLRHIGWDGFVAEEVLTGRFVQLGGFVTHYCNLPDIHLLKFQAALDYLIQTTGFDPGIQSVMPSVSETIEHAEDINQHCLLDSLWLN